VPRRRDEAKEKEEHQDRASRMHLGDVEVKPFLVAEICLDTCPE